jgi:hypothetical protein
VGVAGVRVTEVEVRASDMFAKLSTPFVCVFACRNGLRESIVWKLCTFWLLLLRLVVSTREAYSYSDMFGRRGGVVQQHGCQQLLGGFGRGAPTRR